MTMNHKVEEPSIVQKDFAYVQQHSRNNQIKSAGKKRSVENQNHQSDVMDTKKDWVHDFYYKIEEKGRKNYAGNCKDKKKEECRSEKKYDTTLYGTTERGTLISREK